MATREELITELEQINREMADLFTPRPEAISDYRIQKGLWQKEEANTLAMLNSGEIQTAYKASEADKEKYTIDRCGTLYDQYNEAKRNKEQLDAKYEQLDSRRSVIQTLLRAKDNG